MAKADQAVEDLIESLVAVRDGRKCLSDLPSKMDGVDFSGYDLNNIDFSGLSLVGAVFNESNLAHAKFMNSDLRGADFTGSNMRKANFTASNMESVVLDHVKAKHAGFGMCILDKARMFQAKLSMSTFSKASFNEADVRCADMSMARLREADLSNADFTECNLKSADLSMSTVKGAVFNNADMRQARLRLIKGYEKAKWIGTDIRDINFAGAYLMRRFVMDQNYLKEFRQSSKIAPFIYFIWKITSNCGRSMVLWSLWIFMLAMIFAVLYYSIGFDPGNYPTPFSAFYFSVVTMMTLGYGDAVPNSLAGQIVTIIEVVTGYMMLGGLLSILSNKIARRSD